MTFEEDFPDLNIYEMGDLSDAYGKYCIPKEIQKHCLYKQKVRDVIEEFIGKESLMCNQCEGFVIAPEDTLMFKLLERLGLGE